MSALPLNPSESFKKRNPHLFSGYTPVTSGIPNAMIRQSSKPLMNKLETEYHLMLQADGWDVIMIQALKFKLGNGVWLCPDFVCLDVGRLLAVEVKGFMRDDAAVKLKTAAHLYRFMAWELVWKNKGTWRSQMVLP